MEIQGNIGFKWENPLKDKGISYCKKDKGEFLEIFKQIMHSEDEWVNSNWENKER